MNVIKTETDKTRDMKPHVLLILVLVVLLILILMEMARQSREMDALHILLEEQGRELMEARAKRDAYREKLDNLLHHRRINPRGRGG